MHTVPMHSPIPSPNAAYVDPREYEDYCPTHGYHYGTCTCDRPESETDTLPQVMRLDLLRSMSRSRRRVL